MTVTESAPGSRLTDEQQAMVEANLPLVAWVINRYYKRAVGANDDFEDRYADGMFGLIRAVQKYDPSKGFTFSTYATTWIRQAIQQGHATFEGHGFRYMTGFGARPVRGEYHRPGSLDRPLGHDTDMTVGDRIDSGHDVEADALSAAHMAELQAAVFRACKDPLDVAVAELLTTGEPMQSVADAHGITPEAVRNRKERLATRLRHPAYGLVARIPKAKEAAMTDLATARTNGVGALRCEQCSQTFTGPQGLGAHRRHAHGVVGPTSERTAGKPKKPNPPVLIELVDEDPPPPVLKPIKIPDIDRILAVVEEADMEPGKWKRCAIFISSRAARSMATRLRKRTEAGPYEWYAPGDDRLFVRVTPNE